MRSFRQRAKGLSLALRLHLEGCKPAEVSGTLERQRARGVVLVAAEAVEGEQHDIGDGSQLI
jgi:hypothetical protein